MPKIVYWSEDNGELSLPEHVDITDPKSEPTPSGYVKYEIDDKFTLKPEQVIGSYGQVSEILIRAGVMRRV